MGVAMKQAFNRPVEGASTLERGGLKVSAWKHYNNIKASRPGQMLMVCAPVKVVPYEGGTIMLPIGSMIRVSAIVGDTMFIRYERAGRICAGMIAGESFADLEQRRTAAEG